MKVQSYGLGTFGTVCTIINKRDKYLGWEQWRLGGGLLFSCVLRAVYYDCGSGNFVLSFEANAGI
jgi:hypothetical protein